MKKVFIGVDFSKLKFDAVLIEDVNSSLTTHQLFDNTACGYDAFIQWIKQQTYYQGQSWLICGEDTGLYSYSLTEYLNNSGIDIWLENPLQIKRSLGITRGKNDKVDAGRIALYAYRFQDKARSTKVRADVLQQIKDLMAYRRRLIDIRTCLNVSACQLLDVIKNNSSQYIYWESKIHACYIDSYLKTIDQKIELLLRSDHILYQNARLLLSVKGIGRINMIMIIVLTNNFADFKDPRKFGSYCGVVPFSHTSGTSVKSKDRVSNLANKRMKALLTEAALAAVRHDPKLKEYYIRKLQDGKDRALVINNVRNKLIHIMFAVIKNRKPYDPNYTNTTNNAA